MSRLQRRHSIVDFVNERGQVSFQALRQHFPEASEMTLRTDLKELDAQGKIVRVRGGARAAQEIARADDSYFLRKSRNALQRQQIAKKARDYLQEQFAQKPSVSMFLDCGVTITEIAKFMPDEWCTVVTNSISNAYALAALKKPAVTILGGSLNRYNCCCDSSQTFEELERMNFDMMFLATAGFSTEVGFTCGKEVVDGPRWSIMKKAGKIIVPMLTSKVGLVYPITHAKLEDVDMIITDDDMPEDLKKLFIQRGVEVL